MGTTSNAVASLTTAAAKKEIGHIKTLLEDGAADLIEAGFKISDFIDTGLHKTLGYSTQREFVEAELDISMSHISRLKSIANNAYELGYTMKQIQTIYKRTGHLSALRFYLSNLTEKRSVPEAVKTLRQEGYHNNGHSVVTFHLKTAELKKLEKALKAFGMEKTENGRRVYSTESLIAMADMASSKL